MGKRERREGERGGRGEEEGRERREGKEEERGRREIISIPTSGNYNIIQPYLHNPVLVG